MMTIDEMITILQGAKDGNTLEYRSTANPGMWVELAGGAPYQQCNFDFNCFDYRIKQQPKMRQFKPGEIPVGALLRQKGASQINLILSRDTAGYKICSHGCEPVLHDVLISNSSPENQEFSVDMGKTWKPFGVVE